MYKNLLRNGGKAKNAMFTADGAMKKGMLVVPNFATMVASLPGANTDDVYFVDYSPEPTIETSVRPNMPSTSAVFNDIPDLAKVSLETIEKGESWETDQFDNTDVIIKGDYLEVNTTGKLIKKATASKLVSRSIGAEVTFLQFAVI